nr:DUF447 domain-containing protein [uncultured Methanobrevibacter sp.]
MEIDLSLIGMERGRQYETIITTKNDDGTNHAAPMGVLCSGPDVIINRIFKGSQTLENILKQKEFYVNITQSPHLFTYSLIDDLDNEYFADNNTLKDADAYFKCEVINFKEAVKQSDPIKKKGEAIVFKSKVVELVIKKETEAFNRGFGYVIESLISFLRFDLVDSEEKEFYTKRFKEAYRVVNKVGTRQDIEAMRKIKKELKNKGCDL